MPDLGALAGVLADEGVIKLVHNASFERAVLGQQGLALAGVVDTRALSRQRRGNVAGGHSLRAVCEREIGVVVDKQAQTSDWTRRPLKAWQREYAALDVELLLAVYERLGA